METPPIEQKVEKKKPGRPRKSAATPPVDLRGISDAPSMEDNVFELICYNPSMFTDVFKILKQYKISDIDITFAPTGITIRNKDHFGNSIIDIFIEGKCMHFYYCRGIIETRTGRETFEDALSAINKWHDSICLYLSERDYRSRIYMSLHNKKYDSINNFEIAVTFRDNEPGPVLNDRNYPLIFHLESDDFKSKIANIKKFSKLLVIEKVFGMPLQITHPKSNIASSSESYPNGEKIGLICSLEEDSILYISIPISRIEPFANCVFGDKVKIAASPDDKKLLLSTSIENTSQGHACHIKVYISTLSKEDNYKDI